MKFMLNCRENTELVTKSLDTPLTFRLRLGIAMHLAVCSWCRLYSKQLHWLDRILRKRLSTETLSPEAKARILGKLSE